MTKFFAMLVASLISGISGDGVAQSKTASAVKKAEEQPNTLRGTGAYDSCPDYETVSNSCCIVACGLNCGSYPGTVCYMTTYECSCSYANNPTTNQGLPTNYPTAPTTTTRFPTNYPSGSVYSSPTASSIYSSSSS